MQILVQTTAALILLNRRQPSLPNAALPNPVHGHTVPDTVRF